MIETTLRLDDRFDGRLRGRPVAHVQGEGRGLAPGGQVETNTKNPGGGNGCFIFIVIAILLLFLASSCHR